MNDNFQQLYEAVNNTLKQTKVIRYPKQIKLSEEFIKALEEEVSKHLNVLDESQGIIRNFPEKFLKALKFEIKEIAEAKKSEMPSQVQAMKSIRKPTPQPSRAHSTKKGDKGYNRKHMKKPEDEE